MKTLSLALLLAALPAISAEPPKNKAELVAGSGLVKVERSPFGKQADALVPNLQAFSENSLAKRSVPFVRTARETPADQFEIVFFARTRPVRIRITALHGGKPVLAKWEETLKTLFKAFDRDGDGKLNRQEAELIFSKTEVKSMLSGVVGYRGQGGGALPTLESLDKDGDASASFDEFAHYYDDLTAELVRSREAPYYATPDALTPELFARLDLNDDKRLSEEELKAAEKLLIALDGDEDECVSAFEITSNPVKNKIPVLSAGTGMAMMERPNGKAPTGPTDIMSFPGPLPGSGVQNLLKRYDKDGDYELSRAEIAFPKDVFDKLDTNADEQLEAKELDAWRTGSADFAVELDAGAKTEKCTAKVVPIAKGNLHGIDFVKQMTPDRIVVRVGGQTLDIGASPSSVRPGGQANPYAYLFPAGKDFLREKELVGPQFQLLRVLFEPADWDGDGKLTRAEFDRYFRLQNAVIGESLGLMHQTRTPNLFTLLDSNNDGKLSVKELRSAYERLIPMEPTGGRMVTQAILQPSAVVRLGHAVYGNADPNLQPVQNVNTTGYGTQPSPPEQGPVWFRKMDRNADGDVSRTEFVGPKDSFDAIDANKDGLITLEEAQSYDKRSRK